MAKINQLLKQEENGEKLSPVSKIWSEAVRALTWLQKSLLAWILAAGVSTTAMAQENTDERMYQVAEASDWVEWTVARAFEWIPTTPEEMQEAAERQRVISEVFRLRQNGAEFYGPYLEEFASLPEPDQYDIALLIHSWNGQGWPDYSQETIDLIQNLRIPQSLCEAILDEARKNGADDDWDIPAFEEVLTELRESWETESWDTFVDLVNYSPENVEKIYFVYAVNVSEERLSESEERLSESEERLSESEERLTDSIETRDILQDAVDATRKN